MLKSFLIIGLLTCASAIPATSDGSKKPLRWGIVAAGKICHDFVNALSTLSDHQVVAVGARDLKKAQEFAKLYDIPNAYEGYLPIAQNPDVDVVYIGTINTQHFNNVEMMLNHNKSVLCEKPMTMNYKQTKKLVDLARQKKVFLSEGVWSRAFPVYKDVKNIIESGEIGKVKHVYANIGFDMSDTPRLVKKSLGGGTILDIGVYTLQLQQFVFNKEKPINITAVGHLNSDGVDTSVSAVLGYSEGKTTLLQTEATLQLGNNAVIYGENGRIEIPYFWHPSELKVIVGSETKLTRDYPHPKVKNPCQFDACGGMVYEAQEIKKCLDEGLTENPLITLDESLQLAELMDELRRQVGVTYPEDL